MENKKNKSEDAPGQNKVFDIMVSGEPKTFEGKKISFEEVVKLAYGEDAFQGNFNYTVTYSKGESENPKGTLVAGKDVPVKEGMIFNVKRTIRS